MQQLDDRDRAVLDFEGRAWTYQGTKETAIREVFGFGPARYYQLLSALLDEPAALAHAPLVVKRLQRIRARRAEFRAALRRDLSRG